MMRQRTGLLMAFAAVCLAAVPGGGARVAAPPPGDYPCMTSALGYSSLSGPGGPMLMIRYEASALGTLTLDGKGGYRFSGGSKGRYTFNSGTGKFAITTGSLAGWPMEYEVRNGVPTVIFAPRKNGKVGQTGSHTCRRRGSGNFTDTAPRSGSGGGGTAGAGGGVAGARKGQFRGTLLFHEEWGSKSIVEVDLATGRKRTFLEGRDPYRGANGETVFVNPRGALVIVDRKGVTVATIPVVERDERPDMPVLSPDGGKVAYHVQPIYYDSRVIVAARDGKKVAEFKGVTAPCWTPDNRLVVANALDTQNAKAAISISDAALTRLTSLTSHLDDGRMPSVSPNGKHIAFVNHGHIWTMGIDGSNLKQVTFSNNGEERPAWSPTGDALVIATKEYGIVKVVSLADGKLREVKTPDDKTMQSSGRLNWR